MFYNFIYSKKKSKKLLVFLIKIFIFTLHSDALADPLKTLKS